MCVWVRFCRSSHLPIACNRIFERMCFNEKECSSSSPSSSTEAKRFYIFLEIALFVDSVLNLFMASKSILSAERLFVVTDLASNFLPVCIVNGIFVASEIVGSGKDSVARLIGSRVNPSTLVRAGVMRFDTRKRSGLSVGFTSVLRHLGGGRKPFCAAGNRASVNASISP